MTFTGRPSRFALAFAVALAAFALIGAATVLAVCSTNNYAVTNSAPPPIGNWTDTSGLWSPTGGFPGCATGDTASDTNGSPTTLIINSAIPNPISGLTLNCPGCTIDIQSGGSLTLAGSGTVGGSSTIVVESGGTFTLQNGASLTINSGSSLSVNGGYVDVQSGAQLNLNGASSVANSGTLNVSGTMTVNNTLTVNSGTFLTINGATVNGTGSISVNGRIDQSGATSVISAVLNNNPSGEVYVISGELDVEGGGSGDGPFNIDSGGILNFPSGSYTMTGNGAVSGTGTLEVSGGTLSIGGVTSPSNFTLSSGTLTGAGLLSVSNMTWSGGTMSGTGATSQIVGSGTGNFTGANGAMVLDGRTFNDYGYVNYTATTNPLTLNNSATFGVYGTFDFKADGSIASDGTGSLVIAPNGFLVKSGGSGISTISAQSSNSSTVSAASGTLQFAGSGTHSGHFTANVGTTITFSAPSTDLQGTVDGGGTFSFPSGLTFLDGAYAPTGTTAIGGGTVVVSLPSSTTNLTFTSGTMNLGDTFTMTGTGTWSGGTMSNGGTFDVASGATLTIDAANALAIISNATFVNDGTTNYTAAAPNYLKMVGGTLTNNGTFDIQTDQPIVGIAFAPSSLKPSPTKLKAKPDALIIGGSPVITNNGTFQKSGGSGTTSIDPAFTNTATVLALLGTMDFTTTYTQSSGTTTLGPGGISVASALQLNGGTLNGAGTLTGDLQNSATVAPGDPSTIGTIAITGNYTQAAGGALTMKIGGAASFDQLQVGSAATLAGTLNESLINGYAPANGATFPVMTFASRSGDFAVKNLPTFDGTHGSFTASYTPTELDLTAVVTPSQSDLSMSMNGPATVNAASALSYTIDITNGGADPTSGTTTVVDTLPAGVTGASGSGTNWSCGAPSGGTITCTSTDVIAATANFPTLTIAMTSPSNGGSISNSATVSNANDPNGANNSASVPTSVTAQADLQITKNGPGGVTAGQNITYTIVVTNAGPSSAGNVTVSDPTPANLTFVSASGGGCSTFPCALGPLTSGQIVTITSTYSTSPTFSGNVTNTATVSSTTNDPDNSNNSASATTNVGAQADLSISKNGPASAIPGQTISYVITVSNGGPSPATNTVVTDVTPAGLAFVSNTGACTTQFPCNIGTVNNGSPATITSTYTVASNFTGASITNNASVSSSVNDPSTTNNSASATMTITQQTDLSITKSGPPTASPGGTITYTVTVSNLGPSDAGNVVVSDPTPTGLTFVSNSGACTTAFPCNLGIVTSGQTKTITSTFSVPANFTGTSVTNTASVSSSANDTNPNDDSSSASTSLSPQTDLAINKSGPPSATVGQNVVYTIVVTNNGNLAANNVFVTDPTPSGLTFVSNSGACTNAYPCALGTIGVGQSATITSTYNVPQTYPGTTISNTANVSTSTPDSNSANDSSTAVTPVSTTRVADLSITKSGPASGFAGVGTNVTFKIVVANAGPNNATSVVVSDPAAAGLTWVSNSGACTTPFPCVIPSIGVFQNATINATYTVNNFARATVSNTATVTSSATDPNGANNSSTATIRTTPLPACPQAGPQLLSPAPGANLLSPISFSWTAVPNTLSYALTITGATGSTTITTGTPSASAALAGGNYSWYVVAQGAGNCLPVSSAASSFSVCTTPDAPVASVIGEATTGQTFSVQWNGVIGAGSYELQEASDASFGSPTSFTVNGTSKSFTKVVTGPTAFFYRVRAISPCSGIGGFSEVVRAVVIPLPSPNTPGGPSVNAPVGSGDPITFPLFVPGLPGGTTSFIATADRPWIAVAPTSGLVPPQGITLTITLDPNGLSNGTWTGTVIVAYGSTIITGGRFAPNGSSPTTSVPVSINLVTPVTPGKLTTPSANAQIIPSAGHLAGASSEWRSDVRVANPGASSAQFQITFNGGGSVKQTTITVDAGATVALDDVVRNWFGVGSLGDSANGTLTIDPIGAGRRVVPEDVSKTASSVVTSRTYNAAATGTLGQFIPAVPFLNFLSSAGGSLIVQQIAQSQAYHTNVGVVEASGKPASVVVSTFDASGNRLFDAPITLTGGEQRQMNSFLAQNGVTFTNGHIEVKETGGDGKVTAYASVVDNVSNDPFLVSGVPLGAGATRFVLPGIADLNSGNASWRSDVRIFNGSNAPQTATLTFYPNGNPASSVSHDVAIDPGETKALDGVLQSQFGVSNASGTLHVTTATVSPLVVSARTYDQTSAGTLGQFIAATTLADAPGNGDRALQLVQLEDSPRYRTNVGIAEVSGNPATIEVSVFLPGSKVAPKATIALGAFESKQLPILSSLGLGNTYNARVAIRVIDGTGRIAAYGSVIDQQTQAPVYVPAQ